MATITGNLSGAYRTTVRLSNGSFAFLADFMRAPGGLTITGIVSGASNATVKTGAGLRPLADFIRNPNSETILGTISGYGGYIKDADGTIKTLGEQQITGGVSSALQASTQVQAPGDTGEAKLPGDAGDTGEAELPEDAGEVEPPTSQENIQKPTKAGKNG